MKPISAIHTSCKSCVFAIYNDDTQQSCRLDYLSTYKTNDVEVLEAYDDQKNFFIINNKKCVGYREDKWFTETNNGIPIDNIEDKVQHYKKYNSLDYLLVINMENITEARLEHIFNEISRSIKPSKIIMVRPYDATKTLSYHTIEPILTKASIPWKIQTIVDDSITYDYMLHNITMVGNKSRFIVSINANNTNLAHMINYTNNLVHNELKQFIIITNTTRDCIIYSSATYKYEAVANKKYILNNENYYQTI